MAYYKSNKQPANAQVSDISVFGTEETFMVDLESKVDSLKNISTNINHELQKSRAHLSSLSKTFDSASLSIRTTLSNMSKLTLGYGSKLPVWALGLGAATLLFLFVFALRKLFGRM